MKKLKKQDVARVLELLGETYPDAGCALHFSSNYQLLTAVALSAQTTDKKVNQVTEELFQLCPTADKMAEFDEEELQRILKPIGMYKSKAKNTIAMSRTLVEKYGGEVPESQELLEELPGVGRKTANVVLSVGFGHPRIAVDTHVFRVSNRIGLVDEKDVLSTEKALMKAIPKDQWTVNHHRLIWHGRMLCTARNPKCGECPLDGICLKKMGGFAKAEESKRAKSKDKKLG